jgi:hypothetical protein
MGIYILPIFLFGCAMTGIVFLGIIQANDWATDEAERIRVAGRESQNSTNSEPATAIKVSRN